MNVYVVSNPAMPGLVKIGRSIDVEARLAQLSNVTAVPLPFILEFVDATDGEVCEVERLAHQLLAEHRINPCREFFRASVSQAISAVQTAALISAWNMADREAREDFLAQIDVSVFDRTSAGRAA